VRLRPDTRDDATHPLVAPLSQKLTSELHVPDQATVTVSVPMSPAIVVLDGVVDPFGQTSLTSSVAPGEPGVGASQYVTTV
jgi:hypothetical protein